MRIKFSRAAGIALSFAMLATGCTEYPGASIAAPSSSNMRTGGGSSVSNRKEPSAAESRTTRPAVRTGTGSLTANATSKAQPRTSTTTPSNATHVVSVGQMSLRVPTTWTLDNPVNIHEYALTPDDFTLLPKTSPNADLAISPNNTSPFFSETLRTSGASAELDVWEVAASGTLYYGSISVPLADQATLQQVASRITFPAIATATNVVNLMQHTAGYERTTMVVGADHWLLVGGNPATAQEQFALFHSVDGGKTWSLEVTTRFDPKEDFPARVGAVTIFFWTASDGLIAESSGFAPNNTLFVYRSTDGGKTWSSEQVAVQHMPNGMTAPTITRSNGTLVIQGQTGNHQTYKVESVDGGKTWTQAQ